MGILIYNFLNLNVFVLIGIGGLIYFVLMFLMRAFSKEDIEITKKILKFERK
jgi:hypothetical protein